MYQYLVHVDPLQTPREIRMYLIANLVALDITVIRMLPLCKRDHVILDLFVSWVGKL